MQQLSSTVRQRAGLGYVCSKSLKYEVPRPVGRTLQISYQPVPLACLRNELTGILSKYTAVAISNLTNDPGGMLLPTTA